MNKFFQEILEQPTALKDTLQFYLEGEGKSNLKKVVKVWKENDFDDIIFTGMGSSFFVAHIAANILNNNGIKSLVINASELLHYNLNMISKKSLLVCISQSGESYEIVKLLEKLPEGITCIGVGNEKNSTLIRKSNEFLLTKAGREEMTSTKTYVSTALVMVIFSLSIVSKFDDEEVKNILKAIDAVTCLIDGKGSWLNNSMEFLNLTPIMPLKYGLIQPMAGFLQIIGRGPSYASVLQSALMFNEGAGHPSAGMLGGEFRHGPMEIVKKGFQAIIFAPIGKTFAQSIKLAEDIAQFDGKVILITNSNELLKDQNIYSLYVPCKNEHLFPIASIVPVQFMVNDLALRKGLEPGYFTRGAKVTTIE